jgi:hypothetical protein
VERFPALGSAHARQFAGATNDRDHVSRVIIKGKPEFAARHTIRASSSDSVFLLDGELWMLFTNPKEDGE